jgi:hypothetical protein
MANSLTQHPAATVLESSSLSTSVSLHAPLQTSCQWRPVTRVLRGQGCVRGCSSRDCRPAQGNCATKSTATGSDPSEPAVSSETVPRRMSSSMSWPMNSMPVGTTNSAQVANTCFPAGERPHKTFNLITGVDDTRVFLNFCGRPAPVT